MWAIHGPHIYVGNTNERHMHVNNWKKSILMMQWWTHMNNDYIDHTLYKNNVNVFNAGDTRTTYLCGEKVSIAINA